MDTTSTGENESAATNAEAGKPTIYEMTNKSTGEKIEVVPHTADGEHETSSFAPLSEYGTEKWNEGTTLYTFKNPGNAGELSSEEYDIVATDKHVG